MQIAGSQFLFEQNNRLRDSLLNTKTAEIASTQAQAQVSSNHTQPQAEQENIGATLKISSDGVRAVSRIRQAETSTAFAPTEFSTTSNSTPNFDTTAFSTSKEVQAEDSAQNGNSVLNQYRFFVQSAQYEGAEGTVRRLS